MVAYCSTSASAGALSSGPLPLNMTQGPENTWRHPVVMPVLASAGAFGLFYGAARLARHIPPLNRAIGNVLHYANDGSTALVLLTACANAVAEGTILPRRALVPGAGVTPPRQDHPRLRRHHRRDRQSRAPARRDRDKRALRPPAPRLRWHPGSCAHPPHMVAPHAALSPAPVPDAPAARDHSCLTAPAARRMAADSAPSPHRTGRSARGSPWVLLGFQPPRVGRALAAVLELATVLTWRDGDTFARLPRTHICSVRQDTDQPAGSPLGSQRGHARPRSSIGTAVVR